jgi:hypothetical protein
VGTGQGSAIDGPWHGFGARCVSRGEQRRGRRTTTAATSAPTSSGKLDDAPVVPDSGG